MARILAASITPSARCEVIEALEPRRLLAVFTGTPGPDIFEINIRNTSSLSVSVYVNGNLAGTITNPSDSAFIDALAGDDLILIEQDTRTPSSPEGGLDVFVDGNDGADTIHIDDTANARVESYGFFGPDDFNGPRLEFDFTFPYGGGTYHYSRMENFVLDQNERGTPTLIDWKPSQLHLTVNGNGGEDDVFVGGKVTASPGVHGDLDSDGMDNLTVTGGTGEDSVTFYDHDDDYGIHESENLVLDFFTATKGSTQITYSGFESQTIHAANELTGQVLVDSTVTINGLSSLIGETTIFGGNFRPTVVSLGNGNLSQLGGQITVRGASSGLGLNPFLAVYVDNSAATGNDVVGLFPDRLVSDGGTVHYVEVDVLDFRSGAGDDEIVVWGSAPGQSVRAHGGEGNDRIVIDNGSIASALGPISVTGDAGTDHVAFHNYFDTSFTSANLTRNTFAAANGSPNQSYATFESARVAFGDGGSLLHVRSASVPTTISGGAGDDAVLIGEGDLNAEIAALITFDGDSGDDSVSFDDSADTRNDGYQFLGGDRFRKVVNGLGGPDVSTSGVETRTLHAGNGDNVILVQGSSSALNIFAAGGNDVIAVEDGRRIAVDTGPESPNARVFGDALIVNADAGSGIDLPALVTLAARDADAIAHLTLNAGGTLRLGGEGNREAEDGPTLDLSREVIWNGGVIDVSGGAMIVRDAADPQRLDEYTRFLERGYAGGDWNGRPDERTPGAILSSRSASTPVSDGVAFAPASALLDAFPAPFGGLLVRDADLLFRYSRSGDANLDEVVNADDYFRIDSGFLAQPGHPTYAQGDFNYDGKINADDYFRIDSAFLGQGEPLATGAANATTSSTARRDENALRTSILERQTLRNRPVRSVFSDRLVSVPDLPRRASAARRR